ncbi:hypothetical protein [Mesorhizobium muleiense]|uniref:hypothetical protein n=1 Tax=Mesorhizobium muleiense TaxID=1004279 RepID=UPI001F354427|nr:hypothetical protein [Mesorhizobium muleiense]MCF6112967.1 hypothetical protein [Mesorhizobium muleiense]
MSADVAHRIFPDLNFIVSSFCVTEKHLFIQIVRKVRILHRVTPDIIGQACAAIRAVARQVQPSGRQTTS